VDAGAVVPVGTVLIEIDADSANGSAAAPATVHATETRPAAIEPRAPERAPDASPSRRVHAMPATRRLAKELGVDINAVAGRGPGGRVTTDDVRAASSGAGAAAPASDEERVPLRGLRRKIAEAMAHAARTIPHFTFVAEVDMTEVVAQRESLKGEAARRGVKLTYLPFIVRALLPALRAYPMLNASLDDAAQEIVLKRRYHIGIATASDNGLLVPVVRDADRADLWRLATEIERLAAGARAGKLGLNELTGSTFTVTTTGAKGGVLATPIINHPEVAILGVHEIAKRVVFRDGSVQVRDVANLSLSLDHRVVDGAVAADFLYDVKARLEDSSRPPLA
jgi:pyruvate dehydrogenase E2 component (dihydrolipoamide acetyltransferase)